MGVEDKRQAKERGEGGERQEQQNAGRVGRTLIVCLWLGV